MNRRLVLLSIVLVLVAAFFRFYRLESHVEFLGDQGRDARIMRDLVGGNLVFIGPQTSIGNMYLGPWFYYFMAPSLALFNLNPLGPAAFTAFLGVVTVVLLFFMVRDLFGSTVGGFISALLFALSPTVIRYSTFSWNPNIMPLFSLLYFWFLIKALFYQKPVYLVGASLAFVMCFSSHYLSLILLPITLAMLILAYFTSRKSLTSPPFVKYMVLSAGIFLLSLVPLVLFDIKHSGQNIGAITTFFTQRETTVNLKVYKGLFKIPEILNMFSTSLLGAGNSILAVSLLLVTLVLWVFSYRYYSKLKAPQLWSLFLYLGISLVFMGLYKQHVYDHYFGFLYPFIFILIGLPLAWLLSHSRFIFKLLSLSAVILLCLNFIIHSPSFNPPKDQIRRSRLVAQFIRSKAGQTPFNLALIARQNYDSPYRYFLENPGTFLRPITETRTEQLFVICEPWGLDSCNPINHPFYDIAAFGWSKIDTSWEIEGVTIFRLIPNPQGTAQST